MSVIKFSTLKAFISLLELGCWELAGVFRYSALLKFISGSLFVGVILGVIIIYALDSPMFPLRLFSECLLVFSGLIVLRLVALLLDLRGKEKFCSLTVYASIDNLLTI